jgi:group I intron endonuclease
MKIYSIYSITNTTNGKCYVGMSSNLKSRWEFHCANKKTEQSLVNKDIQAIGADNFELKHIMDCFERADAAKLEAFFIKDLNSKYPNGYNLTDGGLGSTGRINYNKTTRDRRFPTGPRKQDGELNVCYGKFGSAHPSFKNIFLARNLETGEERTLVGAKEIRDAGFNPATVYTVAKKMGRTKHHNHTFELVAH